MRLHGIRAKVRSGKVGTLRCCDLTVICCCKCLYLIYLRVPSHVPLRQSSSSSCFTRLCPPSQAAASHGSFNVDEGGNELTLTEANVASVLHQILREQRDGLYQQGTKMAVKCLEQTTSTCFSQDVKQMVYFRKAHICISRQQDDSVSLRLPAQLLLSRQWKWLGPPVQQQQLPARPRRLFWGGRAGPTLPVLPVSAGSTEPHLPGEPELVPPSTTGLVLHHSTCSILIWNIGNKMIILRDENDENDVWCWFCCCRGETRHEAPRSGHGGIPRSSAARSCACRLWGVAQT